MCMRSSAAPFCASWRESWAIDIIYEHETVDIIFQHFMESYTAEAPADKVPILAVLIAAEALIAAEQERLVIEVPVNAEVLSSAMAVTAEAPADKRLILEALTPAEVIVEALADETSRLSLQRARRGDDRCGLRAHRLFSGSCGRSSWRTQRLWTTRARST